ncbi:MAG: hypothetical protein M3247_04485 [Thermoproteota archaeon]|nr:hypothetical protein [Thermoproteota archaeon]
MIEHWLIKILHLSRRVIKISLDKRNRPVGFRVTELGEAELQACGELSQYYYDMLTKPLNLTSLGL